MNVEGNATNPTGATLPLLNERYQLGERVGEGAFFYIHQGRDAQTGQAIAIKVLKAEYTVDETFKAQLLAETQRSQQLNHSNIARVIDCWRERGSVIIVTEWVRGVNLKDRIRRVAPFPLLVVMDILLACCEALLYAHEQGIVHGDLRPENIIITPEGRVKITDFGVGASVAESTRVQLSALQRSAYYLAPELVEGHTPDVNADVYALGCMGFEMLTGRVPFDAETPVAVAAKHLHQPVPRLHQIAAQTPRAVSGLIAKCMQKSPAARYHGVGELLRDVQKIRDALRNDLSLNWSPLPDPAEPAPVVPEKPRSVYRTRRSEPEDEPGGPSGKTLVTLAAVAVLMITIFSFGLSLIIFGSPGSGPKEVLVPQNLVGISAAEAAARLKDVHLGAEVRNEYHDTVEPGIVYDTAPKSGTQMRNGKSVILFVSKGSEPVEVPDVIGKERTEAQQAIQAAGLVLGETKEEFSEIYAKGEVISQSPIGGVREKRRTPVQLVVSKGPEPPPAPIPTEPDAEPSPDDFDGTDGTPIVRDHEVSVRVPLRSNGPQRVRIVVRNEDGTEVVAYEQDHLPGEEVRQTVTTQGAKGKCQIRVYLNDREVSKNDV